MAESQVQEPRWINGVVPSAEVLGFDGTQILEMECREQPARLRELIDAYAADAAVRDELAKMKAMAAGDGPLLWIGMGGSYCSAISGAAQLQAHGRASFAVDAGEWLHYGRQVWDDAAASILLTTSGESAELVALFKQGSGMPMGLICNNAVSLCWQLAQHKLPILAGPEYGNATKTYTNSTAAAIIAASEMVGYAWEDEARLVVEALAADLERVFAMRGELEAFCRGAANTEVVGRGAAYGAAIMGALTIREMSGHRAAAHTGAGFKHGPNLDVDGTHVALIFAVGHVAELGVKLAAECNRRGGKVILVSYEEREATDALLPVKLTAVPEPWEGITSLVVAQALTLARIERDGCRLPPRFQYGVMQQ